MNCFLSLSKIMKNLSYLANNYLQFFADHWENL